jgi:hypothetical protein
MKRIHQFKIRWPVPLCISVNKLNANYFYSELLGFYRNDSNYFILDVSLIHIIQKLIEGA